MKIRLLALGFGWFERDGNLLEQLRALNNSSCHLLLMTVPLITRTNWADSSNTTCRFWIFKSSLHGDTVRVGKPVKRLQAGCHANLRKCQWSCGHVPAAEGSRRWDELICQPETPVHISTFHPAKLSLFPYWPLGIQRYGNFDISIIVIKLLRLTILSRYPQLLYKCPKNTYIEIISRNLVIFLSY